MTALLDSIRPAPALTHMPACTLHALHALNRRSRPVHPPNRPLIAARRLPLPAPRPARAQDSSGVSRDEMAAALMEVSEGKVPTDRIALRELAREMTQWPALDELSEWRLRGIGRRARGLGWVRADAAAPAESPAARPARQGGPGGHPAARDGAAAPRALHPAKADHVAPPRPAPAACAEARRRASAPSDPDAGLTPAAEDAAAAWRQQGEVRPPMGRDPSEAPKDLTDQLPEWVGYGALYLVSVAPVLIAIGAITVLFLNSLR